jgi:hypothetical protein
LDLWRILASWRSNPDFPRICNIPLPPTYKLSKLEQRDF